ncbi:MAG TPA: tetratricopeptide repeat protein [Vicinamibacterales bacterium]|nr:tetratricopeptide repeat protein [Vicinamibacterales bacterium]
MGCLLLVWLLVGAAAPALAQPPQAPRASAPDLAAMIERAQVALASRRYLEAVAQLTAVVAAAPDNGRAWYLLGQAHWADDRADSLSAQNASDAFAAAVTHSNGLRQPWGRPALESLAVSAVRSEQLDRARAAFARLVDIETDPGKLARYRTQIDEIDLDRGTYQPDAGVRYGPTGEIIGPVGPLAMRTNRWFEKGRHTQDPAKAEDYYRRATEADPIAWQAPLNHGIALARQWRFGEAMAPLAEADRRWTAANPGAGPHVRAHLWRLIGFLELHQPEDAAREVAVLSATPERDPWVSLYLLRYLVVAGRAADAVPSMERFADANPENVEVLYALAEGQLALGKKRDAEATVRRALACLPDGHPTLKYWRQPLTTLLGRALTPGL